MQRITVLAFFALINHALGTGQLEKTLDKKRNTGHITDSVNLSILTSLLILTVLTRWLTITRRFWYVHHTGLALLYGKLTTINQYAIK